MPAWLSQITAFGVFLLIGGVGFLFLLVSLVFGELFEHFDHDADVDIDQGGPGFFSVRTMSVFVTAFGGFGALGIHYGLSMPVASGVGVLGGTAFGSVIYFFARFLYKQQATTEVHTEDLIGQKARVVVAIPAGGVGQVRCQLGEHLVDKIARTKDGQALKENSTVLIEEVLGETVVVRPE